MADILVVDDDPDAAESLADVVVFEGHQARVAYNGDEGLRQIHARVPDLLLLDVDMPMLDGPGMAYAMLVHNMGHEMIPIVLVSGIPGLAAVAQRIGTPYFIAKPFAYEDLVALVSRALTERVAPHAPPAHG